MMRLLPTKGISRKAKTNTQINAAQQQSGNELNNLVRCNYDARLLRSSKQKKLWRDI